MSMCPVSLKFKVTEVSSISRVTLFFGLLGLALFLSGLGAWIRGIKARYLHSRVEDRRFPFLQELVPAELMQDCSFATTFCPKN